MSLTVKDLTKRYGDRTVVDRLSFGMPGPGVYALLGTNGAGKTTSIRMMLNMLSRDGGEVLWNGEPLDISRCNVGYLAEERGLYPKYALMDQLLYFASLRDVPRAEARRRIRYWAQRLEVEEYLYPSAPAQTGRRGHGRHDLLGPVAGLCPLHRHSGDAQPGAAGADLPAGGPGVPGAGGGVRRCADGPGGPGIPADVPV